MTSYFEIKFTKDELDEMVKNRVLRLSDRIQIEARSQQFTNYRVIIRVERLLNVNQF